MDRKKELLVRVYLVLGAFIILAMLIMVRVVKVSLIEGDKWRDKSKHNVTMRTLTAERGNIYSEDFNLLSTSLKFFEIHMDLTVSNEKYFHENVDSLAYYLSTTVGKHKTQKEWKYALLTAKRAKKQYYPIAKKITIDELNKVKKFPVFRLGRNRGGLISESFSKRTKPYSGFASRTIGEDRENASKIGLEGYFDKFLKGDSTQVLMKRISPVKNDWVPIYDLEDFEPGRGNDIVTTINIDIQDVVHNELLSRVVELEAEAGAAIVMDVETGAIKAISNFRRMSNGKYGEVYNDAIGRMSEPGSTFKLASVLALLDDGYCDLESSVDLKGGKMKFYDQWMYDSERHGLGRVTLSDAFKKSSNVGIAKLVHDHYNNKDGRVQFVEKLAQLGVTQKTNVEIVGEKNPKVKHPTKNKKQWYGTTIPWMAHGYELMMTPLQMLSLYNTVANDGVMMKPYLVSEIKDGEKTKKLFRPKVVNEKIASSQAIKGAQKLLQSVVESGTGRKLKSSIVDIAGKTGTTRVNYATIKEGEMKEYNASFAGYFPAVNPKYSMIVVIYKPHGSVYYGASAAGPAFKKIAERITTLSDNLIYSEENQIVAKMELPESNAGYKKDFEKVFDYVGLDYKTKKGGNWVEVDPFETKMLIDKKKISKSRVPSVKGMGARDAIYVLENLGMNVDVSGVGKVIKQTIKPGTKITGQDITIFLN
ncbi:MAG: penicillin-binding protein [Saprospiraceae bacterium]|nr:penicillin-binding protein [Saprospiraceae bacterium]